MHRCEVEGSEIVEVGLDEDKKLFSLKWGKGFLFVAVLIRQAELFHIPD